MVYAWQTALLFRRQSRLRQRDETPVFLNSSHGHMCNVFVKTLKHVKEKFNSLSAALISNKSQSVCGGGMDGSVGLTCSPSALIESWWWLWCLCQAQDERRVDLRG